VSDSNSIVDLGSGAGFGQIEISRKANSNQFIRDWADENDVSEFLVAASIIGEKPEAAHE
jgi:hypothetical protein